MTSSPFPTRLDLTHLPPVRFKASSPESEKTEQRGRPTNPRALSWDRLTHQRDHSTATSEDGTQTPKRRGAKTPDWEGFDFNTAHSSVEQLRFAEGDVGTSKVGGECGRQRDTIFTDHATRQLAKSYYYLLSKSIITRWFLYIFPILVVSCGLAFYTLAIKAHPSPGAFL